MKLKTLFFVFCLSTLSVHIYADKESKVFEATQSASAKSAMLARQKALLHAKNLLATMVNGKVENTTKSYIAHQTLTGLSSDEFISATVATAKTVIEGAEITTDSVVKTKNGYTVFITLTLSKSKVTDSLCKTLSTYASTNPAFDIQKFLEEWNK